MSANECIDALIAQERLPASYRAVVETYWRPLAAKLAGWRKNTDRPIVVGINGGQGSGKTTLAKVLEHCLLPGLGLIGATVSLDDFYLPKAGRQALAKKVHPLLAARGVPGTHDVSMLMQALQKLKAGDAVLLPVFDKSRDDRAPESEWRRVGAADVILFEGWCVGAVPQAEENLKPPVNTLEREEDKDGVWRRYANECLKNEYAHAFALIDRLVMLRTPDMDEVLANRREQERKLREARPGAEGLMSDAEVARFVQFYERLTRHMLAEMPGRADAVYDVAALRKPPGAVSA